jgi:hypothetical protein
MFTTEVYFSRSFPIKVIIKYTHLNIEKQGTLGQPSSSQDLSSSSGVDDGAASCYWKRKRCIRLRKSVKACSR